MGPDTATCSRRSGIPGRSQSSSGWASRSIVVSNVDNLGARIDPAVAGMHVLGGTPLTVEVVAKGADTGGAPARVDGTPQLLEAIRFPADFDQSRIPVFNTNTSWITVDALDRPVDLTWLVARNRSTASRPSNSSGSTTSSRPMSRRRSSSFPATAPGPLPAVKEPADLVEMRPLLRELLAVPSAAL